VDVVHAGCLHAGQRCESSSHFAVERDALRALGIALTTRSESRREHAFGLEAGIGAHQAREASSNEPRADEQQHRNRHRRDGQRGPQSARSCDTAAAAQRLVEVGAARRERRRSAEEQSSEYRRRDAEEHDAPVDAHLAETRDDVSADAPHQRHRGHRQTNA
jgi:cytosine/adenosine deaminase-related metal-dependent hydrolase